MLAEGDKVITRKSIKGSHKESSLGVPATGKQAEINLIDIVRYDDGKLVERWNIVDCWD